MKLIYTIVATLVVLFVITFSLNNTTPIHLGYYDFIDVTVPAYLIIFIFFGTGVIFAGLFGIVERFRLARRISKLRKRVKELEKNQPVIDMKETKSAPEGD